MENKLIPLPPSGYGPLSSAPPAERAEVRPIYTEGASWRVKPRGTIAAAGIHEYWSIIRRRKGTVIIVAFCGAALGMLLTLPQTPIYQARTSLEIQDLNESFLNLKAITPEPQAYNALSDIQTQIKILQSESLAQR